MNGKVPPNMQNRENNMAPLSDMINNNALQNLAVIYYAL